MGCMGQSHFFWSTLCGKLLTIVTAVTIVIDRRRKAPRWRFVIIPVKINNKINNNFRAGGLKYPGDL